MVLSSDAIKEEFRGALEAAENKLVQLDANKEMRLPLFSPMLKLMAEYYS